MFKFIIFTCSLFFSCFAMAGASTVKGKINSLTVYPNRTAVKVVFSEAAINPDGCGGGSFYVLENSSADKLDRSLKVLMSAYLAQKEVSFYLSGCTADNYGGTTRPNINMINLF